MPKLSKLCRHIRSKNAGPFWVTIDLFFHGSEQFEFYRKSPPLTEEKIADIYDTEAGNVKIFFVEDLHVVKISFPRPAPQGWYNERDMHGGQLFVPLLDIEVE